MQEKFIQALRQWKILVVLKHRYNRKTAESLIAKIGWTIGTDLDGPGHGNRCGAQPSQPGYDPPGHEVVFHHDVHEVVKVATRSSTIEEGVNAGCLLNIGITTGAHTLQQLQSAHPDHIIGNLLEMLPIVEAHLSAAQK